MSLVLQIPLYTAILTRIVGSSFNNTFRVVGKAYQKWALIVEEKERVPGAETDLEESSSYFRSWRSLEESRSPKKHDLCRGPSQTEAYLRPYYPYVPI